MLSRFRAIEVPLAWSLYNRASGIGDTQLGESPHKSMLKRSPARDLGMTVSRTAWANRLGVPITLVSRSVVSMTCRITGSRSALLACPRSARSGFQG